MAYETKIGKSLLQQLMFNLYSEPATIYREYIQNACDSILEATKQGLLKKGEGHASISIDKYLRRITIKDNGTGISKDYAESRLKDIASSIKKRQDNQAGFYGIGRLVGGGYCKKLTFTTTAAGEDCASVVTFNVDDIRQMLDDDDCTLEAPEVIDATTTCYQIPAERDEHYFTVELDQVLKNYNRLLDEDEIRIYLIQVAPVAYTPEFRNNLITPSSEGTEFRKYFEELPLIRVSINDSVNITKKYSLTIEGMENEEISKLMFFKFDDPHYGLLAWGWYALTPFSTAIPEMVQKSSGDQKVITRGIRMRVRNILIGDENYFSGINYFKQSRSNTYFNGEIHVVHPNIKPTPDRNSLVPNPETICLNEKIKFYFRNELEKVYAQANKMKKQYENIITAITRSVQTIKDSSVNEEEKGKSEEMVVATVKEYTKELAKNSQSEGVSELQALYKNKLNNELAADLKGGEARQQAEKKIKEEKKEKQGFDAKIDELSALYNENEISFLRKIFNIIDVKYGVKKENFVKELKTTVIKELAKKK